MKSCIVWFFIFAPSMSLVELVCQMDSFRFCVLATEVAQDLRKYILEIYSDFLSEDGLVCSFFLSVLVLCSCINCYWGYLFC